MKYKVGDKVQIKSLDWYNENKDEFNDFLCGEHYFTGSMKKLCSKIFEISNKTVDGYFMLEDKHKYVWTDEMIEGLVEEETKPNTIGEAKTYWDSIKDAWICPEGYQFVDENGNVINATKIVLEKKKKEYPKTYDECCKVLNTDDDSIIDISVPLHYNHLLISFTQLLICRDAYWKIAGEEMGLSGSWKPDFASCKIKYAITYYNNVVSRYSEVDYNSTILVFPTEEMRDVFYENFKKEIEFVKELL